MGKCKFNKYWVTDPKNEFKDIKDWILEVPSDKHKASCKFCKIEITCDGGIRDLRSHAKSVVHKRNAAVIQSNKTFDRKDYTSSTMNTSAATADIAFVTEPDESSVRPANRPTAGTLSIASHFGGNDVKRKEM